MGPAHDVGQALCYWILKGNGQVVARTTVKTITAEDILLNVQLAANIAAMDKEISESNEPYQEYMLKDLDEQDEGHYHDREENCEDDPLAKDLLVGAEVHLPRQEGQDGGKAVASTHLTLPTISPVYILCSHLSPNQLTL